MYLCCKSKNKDLTNVTIKDTIEFIPPISGGKVVDVYDGDTITIASYLPYNNSALYKFKIRLANIDSPEIRSKNKEEKESAILVKNKLSEKILNQNVILENKQNEKYGRILADVILNNQNINDWMLEKKYAVKYDGKTKKSPISWKKYINDSI